MLSRSFSHFTFGLIQTLELFLLVTLWRKRWIIFNGGAISNITNMEEKSVIVKIKSTVKYVHINKGGT